MNNRRNFIKTAIATTVLAPLVGSEALDHCVAGSVASSQGRVHHYNMYPQSVRLSKGHQLNTTQILEGGFKGESISRKRTWNMLCECTTVGVCLEGLVIRLPETDQLIVAGPRHAKLTFDDAAPDYNPTEWGLKQLESMRQQLISGTVL